MLDHVGFGVTDYDRSKAFYATALAPLGISLLLEPVPGVGGFGERQMPYFWIDTRRSAAQHAVHVAFAAADRATVDAFHAAALAAGGADAGPPGPRPEYTQPFYGAFVLDPDGFKVEAVCRQDQGSDARVAQ